MIYWSPGMTLAEVEKKIITEALDYYHGNKTKAAEALGISIRTIRNKIHEYKLYQFRDVVRFGYIERGRN